MRKEPTIGRIVIYKDIVGQTHASIVTATGEDGATDLTAFPPGSNSYPLANVPYDEGAVESEQKPGTWRWPTLT